MKRSILLAGTILALTAAAFAADQKGSKSGKEAKEAKAAPSEVKCAVQPDHKVNIKDATEKKMFADYKGNRYFFCCAGCPEAFKKSPAKFAKADHILTPKDAK